MREKRLGKRERSRLKIMHEARILFEKYGIENVTFQQIADGADVCRTTVFNHFSSTKELMLAIYLKEVEDVKQLCSESDKSGLPMLCVMFDKIIDDTVQYPALVSQLTINAILSKEEDKPIRAFEELVKENVPDDVEDKDAMAVLIMGAFYGLMNHYHTYNKKFEAVAVKKDFKHLLKMLLGNRMDEYGLL